MTLKEIVARYRPESWGRGEDWPQHAARLWRDEGTYMGRLMARMMRTDTWIGGPVIVNDGVVQDAHHRIVLAVELGWDDREISLQEI